MNFIKPKTEIKLLTTQSPDTARAMSEDLKILLANVNPEQLNLLARAVRNPLIKAGAISKLKELFNQ